MCGRRKVGANPLARRLTNVRSFGEVVRPFTQSTSPIRIDAIRGGGKVITIPTDSVRGCCKIVRLFTKLNLSIKLDTTRGWWESKNRFAIDNVRGCYEIARPFTQLTSPIKLAQREMVAPTCGSCEGTHRINFAHKIEAISAWNVRAIVLVGVRQLTGLTLPVQWTQQEVTGRQEHPPLVAMRPPAQLTPPIKVDLGRPNVTGLTLRRQ